jgi:hypothetical protein
VLSTFAFNLNLRRYIEAVKKLHFHDEHDAIVCELGFNRPSWAGAYTRSLQSST